MNARLALCALALVLAAASGCATSGYAPLQPTPEAFAREHPNEVLVTRNDGSTVTLYRPEVVGDTLRGFDRSPSYSGSGARWGFTDGRSAQNPLAWEVTLRNLVRQLLGRP